MRIGLIGCGTHGFNAVIPAIRKYSKRSTLIAVADSNPANLARVEGVARYDNPRRMMTSESPDVVYIATLTDTHCELTLDALAAGCHVVCEKPMADRVEECRIMVDRAKSAKRQLIITFESRYDPHIRQVRRWIDAGRLGRVDAIHFQHFWDGHKVFGQAGERRRRLMERAGGLDCGIHKLDQARFLGKGNWRSLEAYGAWLDEEMEKPPHIGIIGRLDNGVLVTVNASLGYAAQIQPRPMNEILTVVGTRGVVSLAIDAGSVEEFMNTPACLRLFAEDGEESVPIVHPEHTMNIGLLLDDLAETIDEAKPLAPELATGDDGLEAQIAAQQANTKAMEERRRQ